MKKLPAFEGIEEQSKTYAVQERKWVARSASLTVMEFTLAPGEEVPLHWHSDCYDIFYCIEGSMKLACVDVDTGEPYEVQTLEVGQAAKAEAKVAHRPFNHTDRACRFLIIQGFGHKDFILFDKKAA
ncbi:MAG TPA: cupin domain-containing protein [Eoetvoesiella sp.]